jgi:hypothetical protein
MQGTAMHALAFMLGGLIVAFTLRSAVLTFVLPRSVADGFTRAIFTIMLRLFQLRMRATATYAQRDRVMALFAPVALLSLPFAWIVLLICAYTAMFWGIGVHPLRTAFTVSGSSLLTLGFAVSDGIPATVLTFSEAAIGLTLVALLIAYLPTIYSNFSSREAMVSLLEVRAGSPPAAWTLIIRFHALGRLDLLPELWAAWESWFISIDESHTSLGALPFFRSPQPDRSWVTAAGAVLDAAAFARSTVDIPDEPQADLCIRAGFLALRNIAALFGIEHHRHPTFPETPIRVSRAEWDAACEQMREAGVPLKTDLEQAWLDWAGWRVNYDRVLIGICTLVMAPSAPWSGDRAAAFNSVKEMRRMRRLRS